MRHRFEGIKRLLLVILLACGAPPVLAGDETSDDGEIEFVEPIVTEETLPNDVGEWDFRVSAHYAKNGSETTAILPRLSLFFGLAERLGGEISLPLVYQDSDGVDAYDLGPLSASVKFLVVEPELNRPALTVGLEVELPTGDEVEFPTGEAATEEAERNYEITPFVGLLTTVGRATLQGNIGWSLSVPKSEGPTSHSVTYNWAASVPIWREKTYGMIELNGDIGTRNAEDSVSVAPGIRHFLDDDVSIALAVPIGLNENTPDWAVILHWQTGF